MNRLLAIRTFLRALLTHVGLLGAGIFSLVLVALLPTSTAFAASHVAAHPESGGGAVVYVHTTNTSNITNNWTNLDNSVTNNNPQAVVFVTPNWNPTGSSGTYDAHPIGVWYHNGKWHIFNEDQTPIPVGASFNVVVLQHIVQGATVHTAKATNIQANWTTLNNDQANGNHNALVFFTPNMTAQHAFNNHNTGVWFTSQHNWAIFNQDMAAMPVGASFHIVAFSQNVNP
jgi:hypothetical protein